MVLILKLSQVFCALVGFTLVHYWSIWVRIGVVLWSPAGLLIDMNVVGAP